MANVNFKQMALDATTLSPLMTDRTKASTEYMIENYPAGFTIIAFDLVDSSEGTQYPVFNIKEDDKIFYCGGAILGKIVNNWVQAYNGDIDAASEALGADGGLMVRLEESKTKKNNSLTKVVIC